MPTLTRTTSDDPDFRELVRLLDQDLRVRDGDDHAFYAQFNKVNAIKHAVVARHDGTPVGCGALKRFEDQQAEIKRMFVHPAHRRQGIAHAMLAELERWAGELGYTGCVLETGQMQPEAIALYHKCGYRRIPNYGQYVGVANSVCMQKEVG